MAPRRVIEDSDDDGDGVSANSSPEKPVSIALNTSLALPLLQNGTGSTDPIFFQTIYDDHLAPATGEDDVVLDNQSAPVLENPCTNLPIFSSPTSFRKLKRSKTINASSMTSITEPTASNRKAKRIKSMRDVDDLTQITTPMKSKDVAENDPWEFPGSSVSDQHAVMTTKFRSRNATFKTYEKTLRRSKTTDAISSLETLEPVDQPLIGDLTSLPDLEAVPQQRVLKRSAQTQDDDDDIPPTLPKMKRPNRGLSINGPSLWTTTTEIHDNTPQSIVSQSSNIKSTSTTIQVPRSTSEEVRQAATASLNNGSSRATETQLSPEHLGVSTEKILETSSGCFASTNISPSIAVALTTLTDSHKVQYDAVSIASVIQDDRILLPEVMDKMDGNIKYTGESSTIPNDTPRIGLSFAKGATPESPMISSYPLVEAAGLRRRRSKSVDIQPPDSSGIPAPDQSRKRKRRSKTMGHEVESSLRETSVDELSLEQIQSSKDIVKISAKSNQSKSPKAAEDEIVTIDELFGSGEAETLEELYRPRPSSRRSKIITDPSAELDLYLEQSRAPRSKASKGTKSTIQQPKDCRIATSVNSQPSEAICTKPPPSTFTDVVSSTNTQLRTEEYAGTLEDEMLTGSKNDIAVTAVEQKTPEEDGSTDPVLSSQDHENAVSFVPAVRSQAKRRGRPKKVPDTLIGEATIEQSEKSVASETGVNDLTGPPTRDESPAPIMTTEPIAPQQQKRGRPKKAQGNSGDQETTKLLENALASDNDSNEVVKANVDASNITNLDREVENVLITPTQPKKRGRPKKVLDKPVDIQAELLSSQAVKPKSLKRAHSMPSPGVKALQEIVANKQSPGIDEEEHTSVASLSKSAEVLTATSTPPKDKELPQRVQTPTREGKTQNQKGVDQHSPLASGKVPYRVGLSKRTRIAPLLKMIRK